MDHIDRKLLSLLQENARYSLKQLSEIVYLSSPAVAARIERLERDNMIVGYHAEANLEKLGYHITAFINIQIPPKNKPAFVEFIKKVSNVLECDLVSGSYTMMVKAVFPSTSDLDSFITQLQFYGPTETHIVFSEPVPHRGIRLLEEEPAPKD